MKAAQYPESLVILARGVRCTRCGAYPDEPCTTPAGHQADQPHLARIDRAVADYQRRHPRKDEGQF